MPETPSEYILSETGEPVEEEEVEEKSVEASEVDKSLEDSDEDESEEEEEDVTEEEEEADEDEEETDEDESEEDPDEDEEAIPKQVEAIASLLATKGIDYNGIVAEFQNNGKLTPETVAKLDKAGYPEAVVASYIKGQQAIYDRYADKVKTIVGGEKKYTELWKWAKDNLSKKEKVEFNSAVESGDLGKAKFALEGLKARYHNKEGNVAKLIKGAPIKSAKAKAFSTSAEMVKALDDPRYEHDIEYTRKVDQKLLVTDF